MRKFSIVLALTTLGSLAYADTTITIESSDKDNTLIESSTGALSNGSGDIYVGRTAQPTGSIRRGVIHFDIATAGIPGTAHITSATLVMFLERVNDAGDMVRPLYVHAVTQAWGEGSSYQNGGMGGSSQPGDATWINTYYDRAGSNWGSAGGDFEATVSGSGSSSATDFATDSFTGSGMAADVQTWLGSAGSNFGWILLGDEADAQTARRYTSRDTGDDEGDGGFAPQLVITYTN